MVTDAASAPKAAELTAVVLTRNEAENLPACLATLAFAGSVVVVDSGSTDATPELARRAGAEVVEHPLEDFASQRNFALDRVTTEWVLMIDADERVPEPLAREIVRIVKNSQAQPEVAAYRMPRTNFYLGKPVRSARDSVVRLLRTGRARYERLVHERPVVDGAILDLANPLEHHTVRRLEDAVGKLVRYSTLSAQDLAARGGQAGPLSILGHVLARWIKIYVIRGGIRDGMRGFLVAGFEAAGVFLKYALLWERCRKDEGCGPTGAPEARGPRGSRAGR